MRPIDGDRLSKDIAKALRYAPTYIQAAAARCIAIAPAITIEPPPNTPLTLEEMRGMGGQPYWHVGLQEESAPPHWSILDPFFAKHIEDYGYGKRWLAYRRKPEEGTA